MKTLMGALVFSSFILFSSVKSNPGKTLKSRNGSANKIITMAYLLDGNEFDDRNASMNSEVGTWLKEVNKKAQDKLKEALKLPIELEIIEINKTSKTLSERLAHWQSENQVYGGWILGVVKSESMKSTVNPDIICVLTKRMIYDDFHRDMLAYSRHRSLCVSMVPMLFTYKENGVQQSGERLSQLIQNSTLNDLKTVIDECNKQKTSSQGKRRLHLAQ
uniref:Putative ixodes 26 kDa salivary protein n=1 Tax=Ixodes ricinus TaxID=34613 RepID=A0A0K8R8S4_IXORI